MNVFETLYERGEWCPGSKFPYCREYCRWLSNFILYNDIKSIVDFGCGLYREHMGMVTRWGASYHGIDCVPKVIELNNRDYPNDVARRSTVFELQEFGKSNIPSADLLIVKDVFQHWSNERVVDFSSWWRTRKLRFVLLINDFTAKDNADCQDGGYRPLDLRKAPFNVQGATVFAFGYHPDNKVALLVQP